MPNIKALHLQVKIKGRKIFSDLQFSLKSGEGLRVLGPNGSGKTVLLQVMAGILPPSSGALSVDLTGGSGRPVFLPYHGHYDDFLKVDEFLSCWGQMAYMEREIDAWQLDNLLKQRVAHLSVGQFKRVLLATCLSKASSLILLDEPTAGLDDSFIPILQDQLRQRMDGGVMLMVATHQPEIFTGERWGVLNMGASA